MQGATWPPRRDGAPYKATGKSADTADFTVSGFGAQIAVAIDDAEIASMLVQRLPPGAHVSPIGGAPADVNLSVLVHTPPAPDAPRGIALADHCIAGLGQSQDWLLDTFDSHLRFALAQHSRREVFVHAGVVSWAGKAAVFPGRSFAGKTSLVAELIKLGAHYFSDEHAMFDERGWVHPWPKPLSMRGQDRRQRSISAASLGAQTGSQAAPVGLILATGYRARARWRPTLLPVVHGALALFDNALAASRDPVRILDVLSLVAANARAFAGDRPDAARVAPSILAMLESATPLAKTGTGHVG